MRGCIINDVETGRTDVHQIFVEILELLMPDIQQGAVGVSSEISTTAVFGIAKGSRLKGRAAGKLSHGERNMAERFDHP